MDKKEALKFFDAGSELYDQGKYQEAFSYYEVALKSFKSVGDVTGEADTLLEIGNVFGVQEKFKTAEIYYKRSLDLYHKAGDPLGEGYALTGLGVIHEKHGNYKESMDYYDKSYKKFMLVKEYESAQKVLDLNASLLLDLGNREGDSNNLEKAAECYKKSLELYHLNKDRVGEGYALAGLGIVCEHQADYEDSLKYFEKSLRKFQKAGEYEKAGIISSLIASIHKNHDALEDSLIYYKKSSKLFGKVKYSKRQADIDSFMSELHEKRAKPKSTRREAVILVSYLIAIALAEIVTTYYNMQAGIIIDVFIIFALIINSSFSDSYNFSNILRSIIAVPIIRIIGLTLPIMQIQQLYWFPIISIPLFAASFMIIRSQGLGRESLGLVLGNIPLQLAIGLSGIILGYIEYFILKPEPLIPTFTLESLLIASLILVISTGLAEELLFRGIIQKNVENLLGTILGLLYASLLFTSMHIGWNSLLDLIFVFCVAVFYGYAFQRTRSLFGITLSHGISNTVLFLIMPFLI